MNIVGICRFSLLGRGDWKAYQNKPAEEVEQIALEQAVHLFAPARMEARLQSFEQLTLASMRAQTDQNFTFVVLASELMPQPYRARLEAICAGVPQVVLRFFPITSVAAAQRLVFAELGLRLGQTLQFRLDDDDCLCVDFIELMRRNTAGMMKSDLAFAASMRGVMYCKLAGATAGTYNWPVAFFSAGAALRHPTRSVFDFGHFGMAQRFTSITIPGRMALVTNNGMNDTDFTPMMIKRRNMVLMEPEAVAETAARNFPFLDTQARALAGLPDAVAD
ncbi:glycosyltransferase [Paracoccus limosus]|nr:glycosyltransferase [Paracoccus limosus]